MEIDEAELRTFEGLRRVVAALRAPDGCPWDRAQTHLSLRHYLREEAAEALEAIEAGDSQRLAEELGDLLLQVLMHAQIAEEAGEFTLEDVIHGVASKLVRRHPHVFGGQRLETPQQVLRQWDELKRGERGEDASALEGVPATLPALALAQALQRRAARAGFTWPSPQEAWQKLEEELDELRRAPEPGAALHELGDAIFALADLARLLDLDAEDALLLACQRFRQRFQRLEGMARQRGQSLRDLSPTDLARLWQEAAGGPL
ncbi:MAG TPA: nucleoside triphosphate pyrophosphohydrolase [Dehalococcoidia bacterium]|nr:nucleoside triphosphate pyrophosphohydrolase [Dehalococcoidia bacterium]